MADGFQTIRNHEFLFEQGPRSCRPKGNGVETLKLIEDLGLQDQVIPGDPSSSMRYLYTGGKLEALPNGLFSFFMSPLTNGVFKAIWRDLTTAPDPNDETIYSFISRRFSPGIAERLIDPMATGIYAGDIRKLSITSCFPLLKQWEKENGL